MIISETEWFSRFTARYLKKSGTVNANVYGLQRTRPLAD